MNRRRFIQGLLSIPFVGYVASKVDFVDEWLDDGSMDLNEAALEDLMVEMIKDNHIKLRRSLDTSKIQVAADVLNKAFKV